MKREKPDYPIARNILYYMDKRGISCKEMGLAMRTCESTMRRRLNRPESFTLAEIYKIAEKLKISPATLTYSDGIKEMVPEEIV